MHLTVHDWNNWLLTEAVKIYCILYATKLRHRLYVTIALKLHRL